jgi:peptidoglycan/LPS O-acetylase OafA/YrhL
MLVLKVASKLSDKVSARFDDWLLTLAVAIVAFIVFLSGSLLISAIVFRFVELPVTRLRERFSKSERHVA